MFITIARITAILALTTGIIGYRMDQVGIKLIPLELPHENEKIRIDRQKIETVIGYDRYFILAYTAMFLGYALLHWLQRREALMAITTAILAIATAILDVAENRAILKSLPTLYAASAMKWLMFFLVVVACAPLFLRTGRWWVTAIGIAFMIAGLIGVAASISLSFTSHYRDLIAQAMRWSLVPMSAAMVLLFGWPRFLLTR